MDNREFYYDGKHCPYCTKETQYVDSKIIYGRSYGMVYLCSGCDAYCGVHKGTDESLGRLADKDLREWKKKAHFYFDALWKAKQSQGDTKQDARTKAYKWLSSQMNTKPEYTHIGMFDIEQCQKVVEACKPYYK